MCGADWAASSTVSAPTARAASTSRPTGLTVPSTLDWCVNARTFVRSVSSESRSVRSRVKSSAMGIQRSLAPVRRASSCHGTRFAWCSISVTRISSPSRTRRCSGVEASPSPSERATRFSASVAFFVKTISCAEGAPRKAASRSRESS